MLGANLTLNLAADSLSLRGGVSVAELTYDKQRFGSVDLGLFYKQDRGHLADARLTLDGAEVLTVQGDCREGRESPLDLTMTVPASPCSGPTSSCPPTCSAFRAAFRPGSTRAALPSGRNSTEACGSPGPTSASR